MLPTKIKRLRQTEDENRRLKQIVADLTLDNQALKAGDLKKLLTPRARRDAAAYIMKCFGLSERRASSLVGLGRNTLR